MQQVTMTLPFRLVSPNVQEHWSKRHKRNKKQALIIKAKFNALPFKISPPCLVSLIRVAPRAMDQDNLIAAFKGIRDSISALLNPGHAPGQADGQDSGIEWKYSQEKGAPRLNMVRIEIT